MAVVVHSGRGWIVTLLLGLASVNLYGQALATPDEHNSQQLSSPGDSFQANNASSGSDLDRDVEPAASGDSSSNEPASRDTPQTGLMPHKLEQRAQRFQWKPALGQYGLEISIQHAWRFVHENGTVDAVAYGPWFHDWIDSIGATHGWDDEDGWHASYVGHPLNGGIYGFIEQQNDPLYRQVEWGDGRIYWMSRLRAMAFAAVASTQWTLGPLSEASLGNVQLHASPGFIDLVNTPCLGILEMMGEDMIDRYLIIPVENHVANPWILVAVRSLGNPARSFANLMAFHYGWSRATRPGIWGVNHEMRKELVREYKEGLISAPFGPHTAAERAEMNKAIERPPSKEAPIELQAYALYTGFVHGGNCLGGGGQGAARIANAWQIVSEVNGCMVVNTPQYQSADSLTFAAGPRWTPRAAHRFSPFAQVFFGGQKITYEIRDSQKENFLLNAWNDGNGWLPHYPKRSAYTVQYQALGFNMTMGGGFDIVFGRAFAWRVLDVNYSHSWMPPVHGIDSSQAVQVRTGIVLRIGTW